MKLVHVTSAVLIASTIVFSSCAPRGETRTLDQVLESAKVRFSQALNGGTDKNVVQKLAATSGAIDTLLSSNPPSVDSILKMEESLSQLIRVAGATSRPAMNELIKQYGELSKVAKSGGVKPEQIKLISARTYTVLSGELETTRFPG